MDEQPAGGSVPQQPVTGDSLAPGCVPLQQPDRTGYGQPSAYGPPAGYGAPAGYGPPTAYGATAGYGQPSAYGATAGYGSVPGTMRNDLGIWALVLGILSVAGSLTIFTGIPAIILGNKCRDAVARGEANNPGLGTAGIVMGWISVGLAVLGLLLVLGFSALPFAFNGFNALNF